MEGIAMKSFKFNLIMSGMLGAGALMTVPVFSNAAVGQDWDAFGAYSASYQGERIDASGMSTSRGSLASSEFDLNNLDKDVPASGSPYIGTSLESPSGDSDAFRAGVN
jgi:hypothetical protein